MASRKQRGSETLRGCTMAIMSKKPPEPGKQADLGPTPAQVEPAPAPIAEIPAGANTSAASELFGNYADEETLSEKATGKAVVWGRKQHLSKAQLTALQNAVGAPLSAAYDPAAAKAVAQAQRLHGLHSDGKAGAETRQELGVAEGPEKEPRKAKARSGKGAASKQPPADGVSVALYGAGWMAKGKPEKEFERRADQYAKQYNAAGLSDGQLVWGKSTHSIIRRGWFPTSRGFTRRSNTGPKNPQRRTAPRHKSPLPSRLPPGRRRSR